MYDFVREPKWMAAHLLTVLLSIAFVCAGVWQFGRHQARGERNETVVERSTAAILTEADLFGSADDIEYRIVQLEGKWSPNDAVLIRNRSHQEMAGCHLAVPLAINDADAVLVVVGWLHQSSCDVDQLEPPSETVSLTGRVRLSQKRGAIGARDPSSGILASLARTDVARVDQQVPFLLAPVYVELMSSDPSTTPALPLDPPPTHLGPHLAYAVQWFLFFAVGAVGYPLVLRRHARKGDAENLGPGDD
ncbi:MAG: SURF1 family protein [Actinomycetota bacterium]|nr:SURF1 family protein [Actinomycetota bacterium]